jgi:hypothetical protein
LTVIGSYMVRSFLLRVEAPGLFISVYLSSSLSVRVQWWTCG